MLRIGWCGVFAYGFALLSHILTLLSNKKQKSILWNRLNDFDLANLCVIIFLKKRKIHFYTKV